MNCSCLHTDIHPYTAPTQHTHWPRCIIVLTHNSFNDDSSNDGCYCSQRINNINTPSIQHRLMSMSSSLARPCQKFNSFVNMNLLRMRQWMNERTNGDVQQVLIARIHTIVRPTDNTNRNKTRSKLNVK